MNGLLALTVIGWFAVPLLVLFLIYVANLSLASVRFRDFLDIPRNVPAYFPTAVSTMIESSIVGVVLTPDLSRYARNTQDCITALILRNELGNSFSMLIAVFPAIVTNLLDPMAYMVMLGVVFSAFIILVHATWTTNSVNLYSTTLAAAVIMPKLSE